MDYTYIALIIVAVIAIFMATRELMNWYLKINERIKLHEEQNRLLKKIADKLDTEDE